MGFSLSIQQTACVGLLQFALGTSCSGSPTFVADASSPDLTLPLQGAACLGPALFALGVAHSDLFLSPRGCSRAGSAASLLDSSHMDFLLLVRSFVQLNLFLSVSGMAQLDLLPLVPGMSTSGLFLISDAVQVGLASSCQFLVLPTWDHFYLCEVLHIWTQVCLF